jgi:outer membrane protein assembly factor BamB
MRRLLGIALICLVILSFFLITFVPFKSATATTSIDVQVSSSTDDASEHVTLGTWTCSATAGIDIMAGRYDDNNFQYGLGVRFTSINVPQGAIASNCCLSFRADATTPSAGSALRSIIRGQAADNPGTFTSQSDFEGRFGINGGTDQTTNAFVYWNNLPAWSQGIWYKTPDISSIVQEIVNRAGWASGNAMVFTWNDWANQSANSNWYKTDTYDGGYGAKLHIEWAYNNPAITATLTPSATPIQTPTVQAQTVTFYPSSAGRGAQVNVTAIGFVPHTILTTKINYETPTTTPTVVQTDDKGSAAFTILIPTTVCGGCEITVSDGSKTVTEGYVVWCPSYTLSGPKAGPPGSTESMTVSDFLPNVDLGVKFDGAIVSTAPMSLRTDDTGKAEFVLVIPTATVGIHSITVSDGTSIGTMKIDYTVTQAISASGLADTAWPMFRHDPQHTGRSPYLGPTNRSLKWAYTTGGDFTSFPVVGADGTIYIGSDSSLYAINTNGSLKWKYNMGGLLSSSPAIAADGTIYVCSNDGNLYAINPEGTLKWNYHMWDSSSYAYSSPALDNNGVIYVGCQDGTLRAIKGDGSPKWSYSTEGEINSSPAISIDGTVFVGSADGKLYAINPDGSLNWTYTVGGEVSSPVIAPDGTIYIASGSGRDGNVYDSNFYALYSDGSLKWSESLGSWHTPTPAIGLDGTIYVDVRNVVQGAVIAFDTDGNIKWDYIGEVNSPVVDVNSDVYLGSTDGKLYALDNNGTLKWTYAITAAIGTSAAIGPDGTLYFGATDGKLYAIGGNRTAPVVSTGGPTPVPSTESGAGFPLHIIGAGVGATIVISGGSAYIVLFRRRALIMRHYEQKLDEWEKQGYDVLELKKRWFK